MVSIKEQDVEIGRYSDSEFGYDRNFETLYKTPEGEFKVVSEYYQQEPFTKSLSEAQAFDWIVHHDLAGKSDEYLKKYFSKERVDDFSEGMILDQIAHEKKEVFKRKQNYWTSLESMMEDGLGDAIKFVEANFENELVMGAVDEYNRALEFNHYNVHRYEYFNELTQEVDEAEYNKACDWAKQHNRDGIRKYDSAVDRLKEAGLTPEKLSDLKLGFYVMEEIRHLVKEDRWLRQLQQTEPAGIARKETSVDKIVSIVKDSFNGIKKLFQEPTLEENHCKLLLEKKMLQTVKGFNPSINEETLFKVKLQMLEKVQKHKKYPNRLQNILKTMEGFLEQKGEMNFAKLLKTYSKRFDRISGLDVMKSAYDHFKIDGVKWKDLGTKEQNEILKGPGIMLGGYVQRKDFLLDQFRAVVTMVEIKRSQKAIIDFSKAIATSRVLDAEINQEKARIKELTGQKGIEVSVSTSVKNENKKGNTL